METAADNKLVSCQATYFSTWIITIVLSSTNTRTTASARNCGTLYLIFARYSAARSSKSTPTFELGVVENACIIKVNFLPWLRWTCRGGLAVKNVTL